VPYSRLKAELIELLQKEGFIKSYEIINNDNPAMKSIVIELKYYQGQSVIKGIKRVSKPGLRKYVKSKYVPRVLNGLGICVLSTNIGLVTDRKARAEKVGGEMLCLVW
jgi:small subunit ribosomal protein S8